MSRWNNQTTIEAEATTPVLYAEPVVAGPLTQARHNVDAYGNPSNPHPEIGPTEVILEWRGNKWVPVAGAMALITIAGLAVGQMIKGNSQTQSSSIATPAMLALECNPDTIPKTITDVSPMSGEQLSKLSEYIQRPASDLAELDGRFCQTLVIETAQGLNERAVIFKTEAENQYAIVTVAGFQKDGKEAHAVTKTDVAQIP